MSAIHDEIERALRHIAISRPPQRPLTDADRQAAYQVASNARTPAEAWSKTMRAVVTPGTRDGRS